MSGMIEETATVVRVEGDSAWVSTESRSACGHCEARAGCGSAAIGRLFGVRHNLLCLDNRLEARVGEQVVIGVPDTLLVKASALAYMLPLLALIGVAALADQLGYGDGAVVLFGLLGLGLGLWVTRRITGGARGRRAYLPVMLRRASPFVVAATVLSNSVLQ